jgi:EAL domain-containing protein (putative c-di-GMP-specific phosphodiesterase class I)/GGDEF domain-containing protein
MEWLTNPLVWSGVGAGILTGILGTYLLTGRRERGAAPEVEGENRPVTEICRLCKDAIIVTDHDGKVHLANPAAQHLATFENSRSLRQTEPELEFYHPDEKRWYTLEDLFLRHRLRKSTESTLFKYLELGKEKHTQVSVEIRNFSMKEGKIRRSYYVISIHDISHEKKFFDLRHLNTLSGLPNHFMAYGDITSITSRNNDRDRFAVIMVELDDASRLRSMLGYKEIETIIDHISNALRELTENPRVSVYHFNYVTFMILLRQPHSLDEIQSLFQQFQNKVQESYGSLREKQKLTFSAGFSLYPTSNSLYALIDNAFAALAQAQEEGKGHIVMAKRKIDRTIDHEIVLNTEIEKGLRDRDFKLYFQPIYDGKEQRLAGAEVLLRWHHPDKGLIMPNIFIPLAEKSGQILEIGKYVIEESLKQLSRWHSFGFPPLQLSVNLSLRELENLEFMNYLTKMLFRYEIGESRLKFEITEHATMHNPALARQKLEEVRQLGIGISLDDFGTGYSSFAHLAEFPIETLKIDKSFVTDMTRDNSKRHIVSAITKLGHSLGMTIVAEGVESKEEAELLSSFGVDYLQGYYFSRPLPQLEFQYLVSHS